MSFGVVDQERDEVFALDGGAALIVHPDVLPLKAQLEELTLGDGDLHLSMSAGHFCLDDVILCSHTHTRAQ